MSTGVDAARNLMRRSREEHFAVGAFNVDNQETLLAIARAAQAKNAPVLVEVSHGEVAIIGLANMRSLVDNYRVELGVEMYINLDHSPSVSTCLVSRAGPTVTRIRLGLDRCAWLRRGAGRRA
jgi:fructose/tagatose bisphosphate aldolase